MLVERPVLSVTQLNRQIRSLLENDVGDVSVEGEVSNLSKPSSGHYYFTLKDSTAQLRCVYFRNRHNLLQRDNLQNGQRVVAKGVLSLYEARGDYQLIVSELQEAGEGDLFQQFELLKAKLAALGLFEATRKKKLPKFPTCIGVITSSSAAALKDILTTLARRYPLATIILYSCDVQGKMAAPQLKHAIEFANQTMHCDVIILARGGGSIEDLWAFNDEHLAHAIASSLIPIVSGIGHETDFTIADFVADLRAATPTAAAEAVSPDQLELQALLNLLQARLNTTITRLIQHKRLLLQHELQKITSPRQLIVSRWQTVDYLERHLYQAIKQGFTHRQHDLNLLQMRLQAKNPQVFLQHAKAQIHRLEIALIQAIKNKTTQMKQLLVSSQTTLHAVSPLATLDRGYAIVSHQNHVVISSEQVKPGNKINIRLAKGYLKCEVVSSDA